MRKRRERDDQGKARVKRRRATRLGRLKERRLKQRGPGQETVRGRWCLEGFNTGLGSTN